MVADVPSTPPGVHTGPWSGPTPWPDIVPWLILVWGWALPSAYFWHVTNTHQVLLPAIPNLCWGLPGSLWVGAPWLFVAAALVVPGVLVLSARRGLLLSRRVRAIGYALMGVVALIHLLWGGALVGSVGF